MAQQTISLADVVRRDRRAMVSVMATLVTIAASQRTTATQPEQTVAVAVPMLRQSVATAQAAQTIKGLLLASGVGEAEIMAIAESLDREVGMLAALEGAS